MAGTLGAPIRAILDMLGDVSIAAAGGQFVRRVQWGYPSVLIVSEEPSGGSENVTPARTERSDASSSPRHSNQVVEMKLQLAQATDMLAELYELLEKYAPTWYTQHHHEKAESTLRLVKKV